MASSPFCVVPNKASEMPVASLMKMWLCSSCDWVMPQTYHMDSAPPARRKGFGVLPTPDPTIASCISDEDAALQLIWLGDTSNISLGRRQPNKHTIFDFFFLPILASSQPQTRTQLIPALQCGPLYAADSIFIRSHILKVPVHHNKMSTPNPLLRR